MDDTVAQAHGWHSGTNTWVVQWYKYMDGTVAQVHGWHIGTGTWMAQWHKYMDGTVEQVHGWHSGTSTWMPQWHKYMDATVAQVHGWHSGTSTCVHCSSGLWEWERHKVCDARTSTLHNNVPNMQNDICELAINSMHMHLCHPQVSKGPYNLLPRPLE